MRKLLMSTLIVAMLACSPLAAQGVKSCMMVGPYAGYTIGFGDAFDDYEIGGVEYSNGPNLNFGGNIHYGLSDKMMIGGDLYVQRYSGSAEGPGIDISESDTEVNFLFSGLYALSYMQASMLMLNVGAGIYGDESSEFGIYGGIVYEKMVGRTMSLFINPRLHFVLADDTITMLQLAVGLHFWLGNTGSPMN